MLVGPMMEKTFVTVWEEKHNLANNQMRIKSSYQQMRLKIFLKAILEYF